MLGSKTARRFHAVDETDKIAVLFRIATAIASRLDHRQILQMTCQAAAELLGGSRAGLMLFDANSALGTVQAEYGVGVSLGRAIQLNSAAEAALRDFGRPIRVEDVGT